MIHLDANFLIRALVDGSPEDRRVQEWLRGGTELRISAVAWAEFLCGPVEEEAVQVAAQVVREPLSFDGAGARLAARLFNRAGRRRGSLPDCMIASVALRPGAVVATADKSDFDRFAEAGLRTVSP